MNTNARLPSFVSFVAAIVFLAFFVQPALSQATACDPNYVFQFHKTWLVLPTGTDDTANFQCAFNHAATLSHSTVLLSGGTYNTGQVAVFGFVGAFRGLGANTTIIKTLDRPLYVTLQNWWYNPPTPENGSNPWPSIFAFVGGDIVISDLSLYTTENSGTTGWMVGEGTGVIAYELGIGIVVLGSEVLGQNFVEASAALDRVRVEGLPRDGTLLGYNLVNATYYEGFLGASTTNTLPPRLRGKFDVHDSQFRYTGGTNLANLYGSHVFITRNTYRDSFEGMDVGYLFNTTFEFADNKVLNASLFGVDLYGSVDSSAVSIKDNLFTGEGMGLYLDDTVTFAGDMKCRLLKNGVENVTDNGIYLGSGVTGCLVVCKTPSDTVENLGTDNKLINCQEVADSKTLKKDIRPNVLHRKP